MPRSRKSIFYKQKTGRYPSSEGQREEADKMYKERIDGFLNPIEEVLSSIERGTFRLPVSDDLIKKCKKGIKNIKIELSVS